MRARIAFAVLLIALAAPARAQQADPRWSPWLGCWQMLDERVRDGNPSGADAVAAAGQRGSVAPTNINVCVAPAAQPGGVTLSTRVAGEPALEQTIIADAVPHEVNEAGCTGSQRAEWSADGRRLFARAELTCAGQPVRTISGLAMIAPDGRWLDVQAIDVAGRTNVRVRRYRRTSYGARTLPAAAPSLTIAAVKEASAKVAAPVLEAALIESDARFRLNKDALTDLDDANVPGSVTDLMVALSYPDRFLVDRRIEQSLDVFTPPYSYADAEWSGYWGFGYPYFSWYPGYYGNYRYYYSPFGYPYAGLYAPYGYYYGGAGGGTATPPPDTGEGRVISGVGYTRIRPREAVPAESDGAGSNASSGGSGGRSRVTSSGGYSQSGGDSSSGSSGSSGGSSSGSGGGGGGGGGGGRTAQPR